MFSSKLWKKLFMSVICALFVSGQVLPYMVFASNSVDKKPIPTNEQQKVDINDSVLDWDFSTGVKLDSLIVETGSTQDDIFNKNPSSSWENEDAKADTWDQKDAFSDNNPIITKDEKDSSVNSGDNKTEENLSTEDNPEKTIKEETEETITVENQAKNIQT